MDILRPAMLYIGDQCYRKNPLDSRIGVPEDEEDTLVTGNSDYHCYMCQIVALRLLIS